MCHLTNKGLNKKMIRIEIDDFMKCLIETLNKYKTNKSKLLISLMGVGEPLLNIDLIFDVFKNEDKIKALGYESVSYALSTMMPNDNLEKLSVLVNEYNIPIKFIKFNEINTLKKSDNEEIWIKSLKEELPNLNIKSYSPPGRCVGSSCGEFTKHYYHYEIETKEEKENFLKWKKEYEI